jgi:hypothetical protein
VELWRTLLEGCIGITIGRRRWSSLIASGKNAVDLHISPTVEINASFAEEIHQVLGGKRRNGQAGLHLPNLGFGFHLFLAEDNTGDVLAVKGLYSRFSEILPYFPIMVKAVLLPYEGEIIGDGLYTPYNVNFGSSMVGEWNAIYADAKERGEILTSLTGSAHPISSEEKAKKAEVTNRKVIADFEKQLLRTSSSLEIVDRDLATVRQLAQVSLEDRVEPHSLRDLSEKEYSAYLDGLPADARHAPGIGLKRFVQFMRDTRRMDWDEAEDMLMVVKR